MTEETIQQQVAGELTRRGWPFVVDSSAPWVIRHRTNETAIALRVISYGAQLGRVEITGHVRGVRTMVIGENAPSVDRIVARIMPKLPELVTQARLARIERDLADKADVDRLALADELGAIAGSTPRNGNVYLDDRGVLEVRAPDNVVFRLNSLTAAQARALTTFLKGLT